MTIINFFCKRCNKEFFCNIGEIDFRLDEKWRPRFERDIVCPDCGVLNLDRDEIELTEIGQSQLTELWLISKEKENDKNRR